MRLERTRLFGMYRTLYLAIGNVFKQQGLLNEERDIFYLTEDEIAGLSDNSNSSDLLKLIRSRKAEFEGYKKEEVGSRVILPARSQVENPSLNTSGILYGKSCSPGRVEAEAIVITDTEGNFDVEGKIVCALRTDPGWAVIFPSCKAVLIEKGSALSHSVILLRELQIPTIINIPGLTRIVKSGQRLRIDASTGEIEIVDHEG